MTISHERLQELLHYDPETGDIRWRVRVAKRIRVGDLTGSREKRGYRRIMIDARLYLAHRLAWFYVHKEWPEREIDHINCDPSDNRLVNLRPATSSQNKANRRPNRSSSSPFKGATWCKRHRRWLAQIRINGTRKSLGYHASAQEAHAAYCEAAAARDDFTRTY
jgi:hypothetical protein